MNQSFSAQISEEIYAQLILTGTSREEAPYISCIQKAMLDATPDCIKIISIDGRLISMDRAGCLALNVRDDSGFGMPWLPLLPDEVRALGEEALQKAAAGQTSRFLGRSDLPGGVVYWDNLLTPLIDPSGRVLSILCVSRDVTAKAKLERELEDSIRREKLLSREMHHRIKNIFALVAGLVSIAEHEAETDEDAGPVTEILRDKLAALSRASGTIFTNAPSAGQDKADSTEVEAVARSILQPYGRRCSLNGTGAPVCRKVMTTLALFLHELATNSVKYGVLSTRHGDIRVCWQTVDRTLELSWIETGGPRLPAAPVKQGFGSDMVGQLIEAAGGSIDRKWGADGLRVDLRLPLSD